MTSVIYYHGGVPGLARGQRVLSARLAGVRSTASCGAHGVCDPERVYVTTDRAAAVMFASMHPSGRGRVYRVEPLGRLEPDPDCSAQGLSFSCDAALVVERLRVPGKLMRKARQVVTGGASESIPPRRDGDRKTAHRRRPAPSVSRGM